MWSPILETDLDELVQQAEARMDEAILRFWNLLRIRLVKWHLHPWGDAGGGYWVVGLLGQHVGWYNDIEDGFNVSRYATVGEIAEYWCSEQDLADAVGPLLDRLSTDTQNGSVGPPEAV